jgi:hypothetical protein
MVQLLDRQPAATTLFRSSFPPPTAPPVRAGGTMAPSRAVVRPKLKSITVAPRQGKPDPSFSVAHKIPIASRLLFLASTPVPPPASRGGMDANDWEDTDPNVSARRQPDNGFLPSRSPSFGALAPLRPLQNHSNPYSPSPLLAVLQVSRPGS